MNKKILAIIGISAVLIVALLVVFGLGKKQEIKEPGIAVDKGRAARIVKEVLGKDAEGADFTAYLYPKVLQKGDTVKNWDEESAAREISKPTYLAWIDREPGNAFFVHPTQFVYIDAVSGEYEVMDDVFWPVINGESFEGNADTLIETETVASSNEKLLASVGGYVKRQIAGLRPLPVMAQAGGHLRIDPEPENAPPGEYYAVIVSGFGRNAWVFMEGAYEMYEALKSVGYDDAHIMFLGQGRARLDPAWNREGEPKLVASEAVDKATSPDNFKKVMADLGAKMTGKDSLFVFMLTHGKKGKFAVGMPANDAEDIETALRGRPAGLSSDSFAQTLSVKTKKLCELMV